MRIAKVLLLLLALGATAGAFVGLLFFVGLMLFRGSPPSLANGRVFLAAATLGAIVGALSGPPIALLFLRRVPLWRATMETAAAAGLGAAVGGLTNLPYAEAYTALAFGLAAAFRLRYAYRQPTAAVVAPPANKA